MHTRRNQQHQQHVLSFVFLSFEGWIFILLACISLSFSASPSRSSPPTTLNTCFMLKFYFAEHSMYCHLFLFIKYLLIYSFVTPLFAARRSTLFPTSTTASLYWKFTWHGITISLYLASPIINSLEWSTFVDVKYYNYCIAILVI